MKHLYESILDQGFDIKDPSPCAIEVFDLLDKSKCHHWNAAPMACALLYDFPIQDDFYKIFSKHAKKISITTARKKDNVAVCWMTNPYIEIDKIGGSNVVMISMKLNGKSFFIRSMQRSGDTYCYGIGYNRYKSIKYSRSGTKYEYYEIPEDAVDMIYKQFKYFKDFKW